VRLGGQELLERLRRLLPIVGADLVARDDQEPDRLALFGGPGGCAARQGGGQDRECQSEAVHTSFSLGVSF